MKIEAAVRTLAISRSSMRQQLRLPGLGEGHPALHHPVGDPQEAAAHQVAGVLHIGREVQDLPQARMVRLAQPLGVQEVT